MGVVLPYPEFELLENFGEGEVLDTSPPSSPLGDFGFQSGILDISRPYWAPFKVEGGHQSNLQLSTYSPQVILANAPSEMDNSKGKGKTSTEYAFMHNGLLTQQALRILDEGRLIPISKVFYSPVVNLDNEVFPGIFARDVLDCDVKGSLGELLSAALVRKDMKSLFISEKEPVASARDSFKSGTSSKKEQSG